VTAKVMYSSMSGEWETPPELFDRLNKAFGFTLDVCATQGNAKCERYFTIEDNGLEQPWEGRCWMNPPYGRDIKLWVQKASESARTNGCLVVGLIPARTDTLWWRVWVQGTIPADVCFIPGRVPFVNPSHQGRTRAPYPSAIAVWWPKPWGGV
jgi:phage N-6-adenine-methyltransferase